MFAGQAGVTYKQPSSPVGVAGFASLAANPRNKLWIPSRVLERCVDTRGQVVADFTDHAFPDVGHGIVERTDPAHGFSEGRHDTIGRPCFGDLRGVVEATGRLLDRVTNELDAPVNL